MKDSTPNLRRLDAVLNHRILTAPTVQEQRRSWNEKTAAKRVLERLPDAHVDGAAERMLEAIQRMAGSV